MPCLSFDVYRDKSDIIFRSIIGQNQMFNMLTNEIFIYDFATMKHNF